jgi:two-component system response regulator (stage 0 sporulation protein F)
VDVVIASPDNAAFGTLVEHGRSGPLPPVRRSPPASKSARTTTVLVADDDDDIREAIRDVLTDENGWNVLEAKDGAEALALTLARRPDALILDQRMPEMTGAEVVVALREAGVLIPAVLIGGAGDIESLAGTSGIEHVLRKPFGYDQLMSLVSRVMARG